MEKNSKIVLLLFLLLSCSNSLKAFQLKEIGAKDTTNASLSDSLLNKGNEQDVLGLASGLFPGMLVSKAGSDPNLPYDARVRGIGTVIGNQNPLIVIDGLIGVPTSMIDVNDIASMRLIKGASTAQYGMQGANGVLEISTKDFYDQPLRVRFNQSVFVEEKIYKEKVMGRDAFLAYGGQDLGEDTNWNELISQSALSTVSNLSINGSSGDFSYYLSANLRLVDGILKETGVDRKNFLAKASWRVSDKMKINYSAGFTSSESDLGFGQTFRYANKVNPTSPVYFETGDLYNALQFDYFNPLSFVQDAYRKSNEDVFSQSVSLERRIGNGKISLNGGFWNSSGGQTTEYSPDFVFGYYVGNSTTSAFEMKGYNASVTYQGGLRNLGSIQFQETISAGAYNRQLESRDRRVFDGAFLDTSDMDELELNHLNILIDAQLNSYMNGQLNLRYEQSSALGANNNSGIFPSLTVQIDLGAKFEKLKDFDMNLGYGVSGLTLYDDDYAKTGDQGPFFFSEENPDLGHEKSVNTEIGISYQPEGKPWMASLTRYGRKATDLMGLGVEGPINAFSIIRDKLQNNGELMNSGWEIFGQYTLKIPAFTLTSSLSASTLKTEWKSYPIEGGAKMGYLERSSSQFILFEEGQPYGAFSGYEAVVRNDNIVFLDTNGDVSINGEDETVIGQALPKFWFGWRNQLQRNNTTLTFMLEGMTGHHIMNSTNYYQGSEDRNSITENMLADRLGYEGFPIFPNSLFVENASFVRLRYLSVEQKLNFGNFEFSLYGAVNNLFTLTAFRGNDPSARILDYFYNEPYQSVIPGIQRTQEWLPSRSFMIGLKVQF